MKAKGFNLLKWNKNVDFEFVGRHLLDPVDSKDEAYISSKVMEQLTGTSVTVVLLGRETCHSEWVKWEIEKSLEKNHPNGILAIKLENDIEVAEGSPVGRILCDCGAEIMEWEPSKFEEGVERATKAAGRIVAMKVSSTASSCAR